MIVQQLWKNVLRKRVVAHSHGEFVDYDIDEALAMKKDIDEYQYAISRNLAR